LVGKEFSPFVMPIEQGKIREFANAIGDDNPIYLDPAYARKSEFGNILAPPTFTATKAFWRPAGWIPGSGFTEKKDMSTTGPSWAENQRAEKVVTGMIVAEVLSHPAPLRPGEKNESHSF
jgi:hypothetical protein